MVVVTGREVVYAPAKFLDDFSMEESDGLFSGGGGQYGGGCHYGTSIGCRLDG